MPARTLLACLALALAGCASMAPLGPLKVVSDTKLPGTFVFPESVGCDLRENVLYVSNFGGTQLRPAEKDGLGYVSKLSPDGKVLEERAFAVTMNKPKGIWIEEQRLWVTDIDGVWIFDTRTKRGRKLPIPGVQFANDPALAGAVLYVSDNRSDQIFRIEPADFLDDRVQPKITAVAVKKDVNPNGLWPARDGSLLVAGFVAPDKPRAIHSLAADGATITAISAPIGRLDGLYETRSRSLLVTDWNTGSLFEWSKEGGTNTLAKGFKGPADFCVLGDTVYVPDLPGSEVRAIKLAR